VVLGVFVNHVALRIDYEGHIEEPVLDDFGQTGLALRDDVSLILFRNFTESIGFGPWYVNPEISGSRDMGYIECRAMILTGMLILTTNMAPWIMFSIWLIFRMMSDLLPIPRQVVERPIARYGGTATRFFDFSDLVFDMIPFAPKPALIIIPRAFTRTLPTGVKASGLGLHLIGIFQNDLSH